LGAFHVEHADSWTTARLAAYARAVRSSPHNLLSRAGLEELETRHILESVRFAQRLPACDRLLDIGSGGGLPGIVIAIVRPEVDVHLMESTRKKAEFLRSVADELGLRVTVHNDRAEDLAQTELASSFPVVTARAVARLDRLIALSAPFLAPGGQLHAIKGERWAQEVTEATSEIARRRLVVVATPAHRPDQDPRVVVVGRGGTTPSRRDA
jgi:16S rRNA (guanine527-N7)-methyltransferase